MTPDNPLFWLTMIPPRIRQWIYFALFLAVFVFSAWQAAKGNWILFASGLAASITHGMAAMNTNTGTAQDTVNRIVSRDDPGNGNSGTF